MACDRQRNLRRGFLTYHNTSNRDSHGHGCNANYYAESSPHATGFVSSFISVPSIIRKAPYTNPREMASDTTNLWAIMIFFLIYIYIYPDKKFPIEKEIFGLLLLCLVLSFLTRMVTRHESLRFIIILYDKYLNLGLLQGLLYPPQRHKSISRTLSSDSTDGTITR